MAAAFILGAQPVVADVVFQKEPVVIQYNGTSFSRYHDEFGLDEIQQILEIPYLKTPSGTALARV